MSAAPRVNGSTGPSRSSGTKTCRCTRTVFDGPDVDGEHVVWSFLRDLIADGVDGPAGMGDVQFYPHLSGRICLTLSAPEGELTLMCLRRELVDFVEDTYFRVPRGAEQVDVDVDAELFLLIQREGSL